MPSQRTLLGLVLAFAAAGAAAQTHGALRWRGGAHAPLGLHLNEWRAPCGSVVFPCDGAIGTLPLYANTTGSRSVALQVNAGEAARLPELWRPQDLNVSIIGSTALAPELGLGLYGRLGTTSPRALKAGIAQEGGLTYGIGLSWNFSRRGSATLGWDTYDFRSLGGEARDVRATSLGLQWRY